MKSLTHATSVLALSLGFGAAAMASEATKSAVLDTYSDIAEAKYADSLATAKVLQAAVDALIASPSAETLQAAKTAWVAARVPYQQTEVYRFGNAIVDDWEGKVNAWPLDEGLIDYVDASYGGPSDENEFAVLNVVANPSFTLSGATVDASAITPALLEETLHEADGDRGQCRHRLSRHRVSAVGPGPERPRPGRRQPPLDRLRLGRGLHRRQLRPARRLPEGRHRSDWCPTWNGWPHNGATAGPHGPPLMADEDAGIVAMLTGMGSLSYGEQAGERMRLGSDAERSRGRA